MSVFAFTRSLMDDSSCQDVRFVVGIHDASTIAPAAITVAPAGSILTTKVSSLTHLLLSLSRKHLRMTQVLWVMSCAF